MADESAVETAEEKPDRRDQLAAALDAAEEAPTTDAGAAEAPALDVEAAPKGEDGKFLAAQPVDAPVSAEPAEEPLWSRPPASWKKDKHELWLTAAKNPELAPLVEYTYQREEEMRRGIEPLLPKAKFADAVEQAMEPYKANQQAAGVNSLQAISALMQADHILRTAAPEQKKAYAINLLAQYGVQITPEDAYTFSRPLPYDPRLAALENQLNSTRNEVLTWKQQQEEAESQSLLSEIERFSQGKNHFEEVRPAMIQLLQSGVAQDLSDAYEKAMRLDDNLFKQTQAAQLAQAEAAKREAADKAAKAAKAAAVSVRSSTPRATTLTKAQDRRSVLEEQFNSLAERF